MIPRLPAPASLAAHPFVRALPPVLREAVPFGVAVALALLVRHLIVEPASIAHVCDPAPWAGPCALRTLVVLGFTTQGIGWGATAVALAATGARSRPLAQLALTLGGIGLVLYSFALSAFGALLAMLVLVRAGGSPMHETANSATPPTNTTA